MEDWVLLISTSDSPCGADMNVIHKTSEEEITFFPHTGYATRYDACSGLSELALKLKPGASSWTTPAR